jgi:molecular chaperone DnaK (HSP70)
MRYIIGIDLGTTNSAVSFINTSASPPLSRHDPVSETSVEPSVKVETFGIPQLTGPGEISDLKVLPSFLYLPGEHEIKKEAFNLPRSFQEKAFAGAFARDQGARVPHRMVASAKSWLCHGKVDRRAPILPWGAGEEVAKLSPVAATSAYLNHIKQAWNHSRGGEEDLYLERQTVVITVPASFDEVGRDLTLEAAHQAGIENIVLLEEPLAAFYSWLMGHQQGWQEIVRPGELVLVCDVGGGTTDFTLIALRADNRDPVFERIAVGDHLILGGDNMDLALAHRLERHLRTKQTGPLNINRWQALCHQCRQAKEEILSGIEKSKLITLVGEGRKLISDTVSMRLSRKEIEETILDGFFPVIDRTDMPDEGPRRGITEFGLPYAHDPAITRHLLRFLEQHRDDVLQALGRKTPRPDLILFNGAPLKPHRIQDRICKAIRSWFNEKDESLPRVLKNPDLDLAVALGASYYGLTRKRQGIRVLSGSARAYYLGIFVGVGAPERERVCANPPKKAICVVERGMAEGTKNELRDKRFYVLANQPVRFYLYSSAFRAGDRVGDVITVDNSLTPLPPLHTVIQFGKKAKETKVPVKVEAWYTELGTLALWCRSVRSIHRWRFQFQLRGPDHAVAASQEEMFDKGVVDQALEHLRMAFSSEPADTRASRLVRTIGDLVQAPKEKWPLNLIRRMADELISLGPARKLSPEHESRWLNLTGFCMRPGFGDPLDSHRMEALWKIFQDGPMHPQKAQVRADWWVLWRRVAGGLSNNHQHHVFQEMSRLTRPKKAVKKTRLPPQEHMELWMAMANMELLPVPDKVVWGRLLLDYLTPKKSRNQYWWSLSRIGGREPLYGPIDLVILPDEVTAWIDQILSRSWPNPRSVGTAVAQMSRLTGDRKRDLDPQTIQKIIKWFSPFDWSKSYIKILEEVLPVGQQEQSAIFGEPLPSGIFLHMD